MKKIICAILLTAAVLFIFAGCEEIQTALPENMPENFSIRYEEWLNESNKNILDTGEGYIQKDLVTAGTARANYIPTKEVMEEIYAKIREFKLDRINRVMTSEALSKTDKAIHVTPCTYYKVTFCADDRTISVEGDCTMKEYIDKEKDAAAFNGFIEYMRNLYMSTDEYESLPAAEGGYD